ncbi:MAG: ABC transporter substrate-binding protein [Acidimicrobiia bacterium]|jgi:osmoprotectant transport system substrate-binding protein|nr:ABC transporter substrate-binding protein [Acidimicrobiia bacterium]
MTRSNRTLAVVAAVPLLLLAACGDSDEDTATDTTSGGAEEEGAGEELGTIRIGSANFPENVLLAEIYGQALEAEGYTIELQPNIGSREVYFGEIESGNLDLLPEYTNSLLNFVTEGEFEATTTDEQVAELAEVLPEGLGVLEPSEAEDKDVLVCSAEAAEEHGLAALSDITPEIGAELVVGGPPEFAERTSFGVPAFRDELGVEFAEFVPLEIGPPIVDALSSGAIDCGNLFSTGSAIAANDFVALEDDVDLVSNENIIPLVRTEAVDEAASEVLNEISGLLTTENLTEMLVSVEIDAESETDVATAFLEEEGILGG